MVYEKAAEIAQKYLGPDHPALIKIFSQLGCAYQYQSKYKQAKSAA